MIFWDSSAIVPLLLVQEGSRKLQAVLRKDNDIMVWWGTVVECMSAVARAERSRSVAPRDIERARRTLRGLRDRWNEIHPSDEVRERAGAGVFRHPLRAADSLQLGAALTWARGRPAGHGFLSLDDRLAGAARREGFDLVHTPDQHARRS